MQDFDNTRVSTVNVASPSAKPNQIYDLLAQIDTLQRERDHYAEEANIEKAKCAELEKEFHVLRGLIGEMQP